MLITVTDIHADHTATIAADDFAAIVTPWFDGSPAEIADALESLAADLRSGTFDAEAAVSFLGLKIEEA